MKDPRTALSRPTRWVLGVVLLALGIWLAVLLDNPDLHKIDHAPGGLLAGVGVFFLLPVQRSDDDPED